ncbi:cysteine-rich PDZ-binding protein [Motacilla alba alba]|uniref:cysteine-rich PDZ-binding protein n=1 Tax=Motacilla alba alba TaxID=1094192 RepID=UPI0018D54BA8|nr:cysteine-rich PDZ-binding protein [Motacilla alba alba]
MARAQSRLAARSLLISASLMASGGGTCNTPRPAPSPPRRGGAAGRHLPRPRRAGQSCGARQGRRGGFWGGKQRLSKNTKPRAGSYRGARGAARQRKAAGPGRRHLRGGAGSGGGCGGAAMVCDKCEKKLGTVITPDTWKDGARNTTESGGRKLNENKALTSKKARFDPYGKNKFAICRICKSSVHQPGSHYCQGCAYKKGICSMCGKKVLDTKNYKQTSV